MTPEDFVHLHCHSTYSLLEGLPQPEEIVERIAELKQTAVALTDKGNTYGLIEFYKEAKNAGIKPILGMQAFVAPTSRFDKEKGMGKSYPLVLLAETDEGYRNLLMLATKASLEGMYYRPRVDHELFKEYGKGLIALSGPLSGAIPQAALAEDHARLKELVEQYRSFFGPENLYFELMDLPGVPGQKEINQQLIAAAKDLNVPLVAACGSHYCRTDDAEAQDVLLCIQKGARVSDPHRFSMRSSDLSLRPFEEVAAAFAHVPEALTNTRVIADRCNVKIAFGQYKIPKFPVPRGSTEQSLLKQKCEEALLERYGFSIDKVPAEKQPILDRMHYELDVIEKMGFSGYFLIVADFVQEAKRRGITVGPGRGSAAGSIVSYLLDVTTLDPLKHGLLFERFLNPERISMPDIDMDFADTRRDEVLEYVREKYGRDRVVQICTFGTLAARAAVKDVGRVFGVPFAEMNELVKLIPERPGTKLKDAVATHEMEAVVRSNETYQKIVDVALKLEGKARHVSVHACGVVITPEPTVRYTALQIAPKDEHTIITQYHAKPLEALGLLKMDFLGLKNLTIIETALAIIERIHGVKIDIRHIPTDDAETFALLSRGETTGVFQLESAGMRRYLKQLKPSAFDDITAMVSLYRPGPMDKIPEYIRCKHGETAVTYLHKDLEPILQPTYGVGIYQEQILEMARVFAGFSLGEADLLRRAIGKKIKEELDEQRDKFIDGAVKKGYDKKLAVKLFDDVITPFAGYGFNKSHGASYARIAYETAYLKAHYPTEFMAALLSSEGGDTDRIAIEIGEARQMGILVLPPDINESLAHFTALPDKNIRFGLTAIKGVGESTVRTMIDIRERSGKFASIEDFASRVPPKLLNKKVMEALAKSGALDSLGERGALVEQYDKVLSFCKASGAVAEAQGDLFDGLNDNNATRIAFEPQEPASAQQKLLWEKETLGLYVSSHPLAGLTKYWKKKARLMSSFTKDDVNKSVMIAGIVEGVKKMTTKKGESMAALTLQDPTGEIEVMLFPKMYAQAAALIGSPDAVLAVEGTLDRRGGLLQVRAESVRRGSLVRMIEKARETNVFDEEEAKRGLTIGKAELKQENIEVIDEEGNIITETVSENGLDTGSTENQFFGPMAQWIAKGMDTAGPLAELRLIDQAETSSSPATDISIHTIDLPASAPRELLIELKTLFETFPGSERVQLKIGERIVAVPLTVSMSTILQNRIEKAVQAYTSVA